MEVLRRELISQLESDLYVSDTGLVDGLIEEGYLSADDWVAIHSIQRPKKKVRALITCLFKSSQPELALRSLARLLGLSHDHLVSKVEHLIEQFENDKLKDTNCNRQYLKVREKDENRNHVLSSKRVAVQHDEHSESIFTTASSRFAVEHEYANSICDLERSIDSLNNFDFEGMSGTTHCYACQSLHRESINTVYSSYSSKRASLCSKHLTCHMEDVLNSHSKQSHLKHNHSKLGSWTPVNVNSSPHASYSSVGITRFLCNTSRSSHDNLRYRDGNHNVEETEDFDTVDGFPMENTESNDSFSNHHSYVKPSLNKTNQTFTNIAEDTQVPTGSNDTCRIIDHIQSSVNDKEVTLSECQAVGYNGQIRTDTNAIDNEVKRSKTKCDSSFKCNETKIRHMHDTESVEMVDQSLNIHESITTTRISSYSCRYRRTEKQKIHEASCLSFVNNGRPCPSDGDDDIELFNRKMSYESSRSHLINQMKVGTNSSHDTKETHTRINSDTNVESFNFTELSIKKLNNDDKIAQIRTESQIQLKCDYQPKQNCIVSATDSSDAEANTDVCPSDLTSNEQNIYSWINENSGQVSDIVDELIESGELSGDDYKALHETRAYNRKCARLARIICSRNRGALEKHIHVNDKFKDKDNDTKLSEEKLVNNDASNMLSVPSEISSAGFKVIQNLEATFDQFNKMLNEGALQIDHLPDNPDVLCIVYYLQACDNLYQANYEIAEEYIARADDVIAKTSYPVQLRIELLTAKTWLSLNTNRLGKMQFLLEENEQYIKCFPDDWSYKARGWLYFDYARCYQALMEHSIFQNKGRKEQKWVGVKDTNRQRAIQCASRAADYFKLSDSSDGPIGLGFSLCTIATLYLQCGRKFNMLELSVPDSNIDDAERALQTVTRLDSGIPPVLRSTYLICKCDLTYRRGNVNEARDLAAQALSLSEKLNLHDETKDARFRTNALDGIMAKTDFRNRKECSF